MKPYARKPYVRKKVECRCSECNTVPLGFSYISKPSLKRHIERELIRQRNSIPVTRTAFPDDGFPPVAGPSKIDDTMPMETCDSSLDDVDVQSFTSGTGSEEGDDVEEDPSQLFERPAFGNGEDNERDEDKAGNEDETLRDRWPLTPEPVGDCPLPAPAFVLPRSHYLSPAERAVYTQAATASVEGVHFNAVSKLLLCTNTMLEITGQPNPTPTTNPYEAYSRLGVNPDEVIKKYATCSSDDCYHLVSLEDWRPVMDDHLDPNGRICMGSMSIASGKKHQPARVMPFTPPSTMLRLFCRDQTFVDALQLWRAAGGDDDAIGNRLPIRNYTHPHDVMTDIKSADIWRSLDAGSRREFVNGRVEDKVVGQSQRLVSLEFGLVAAINIDWFTVKQLEDSSIGAVYVTILNLPRDMFFRRQWTILTAVIPGPKEPSALALNNVLRPLVDDLVQLEKGIMVHVVGRREPERLHMQVAFSASDMPATRKLAQAVSWNTQGHPCNHCNINGGEIKLHSGYDLPGLERRMRNPSALVNASFRHRDGTPAERAAIEAEYGVRWTEFARLSSFHHGLFCPPDAMHNILLGLTRSLLVWLIRSGTFVDLDEQRNDAPGMPANPQPARVKLRTMRLKRFEQALIDIIWPSHIGRVPANVLRLVTTGSDASGLKADELQRILSALPLLLWLSWCDNGDSKPAASAKPRREIMYTVRDFCSAVRTLLSSSITRVEAAEAQEILSDAARSFMRLGLQPTINWHTAMHYSSFIERLGPVGGYSTWPYERNNSFIARGRYLSGNARDVPTTAARQWAQIQMLQMVLKDTAPNATEAELAFNKQLLHSFASRRVGDTRGTLTDPVDDTSAPSFTLPESSTSEFTLHQEPGLYRATLEYLGRVFRTATIRYEGELTNTPHEVMLDSGAVKCYPYIKFPGRRYTSEVYHRTKRDRWCLAEHPLYPDEPQPCRVEHIYHLLLPGQYYGAGWETKATVAAVRFLAPDHQWIHGSLYSYYDLGFQLANFPDTTAPPTVISVTSLGVPLAVKVVDTREGERLFFMPIDKDIAHQRGLQDDDDSEPE